MTAATLALHGYAENGDRAVSIDVAQEHGDPADRRGSALLVVGRARDQGEQAHLVEQVDRAQGDARGDVVEAGAHPLHRDAGQP
jgi:hypothetical protein